MINQQVIDFVRNNQSLARFAVENIPASKMGSPISALGGLTYSQIMGALETIDGEREARLIERMERCGGPAAYREMTQSGNTAFPDTDPSDGFDA